MAERYLAEMKYDEAILALNKIIEIDEKNIEAYIGLAEIYEVQAEIALNAENFELAKELYALSEEMYWKILQIDSESESGKKVWKSLEKYFK